jgi:hypothetical protein
MAEQNTPQPAIDLNRVARIVGSYVRHHQIGLDQLAGLIGEVHRALASLGRSTQEEPLMPAFRFVARCSRTMWYASSAAITPRCFVAICEPPMTSKLPITERAGNCLQIIR